MFTTIMLYDAACKPFHVSLLISEVFSVLTFQMGISSCSIPNGQNGV
ncbi:hypothetical protein GLUCOINTEAF2_0203906 [Komagataeibacter intermedius AF2]|uniref:Uncharacterized protein n=1 Tax=Komagataeibacter intermedius AF2 TaxID=1458464 RepID=A0A0N0MG14_9PROT|nr:hypothetical protein GLUCOINTEAF2_0203906 [Komagataeibacter intermedius AF2]